MTAKTHANCAKLTRTGWLFDGLQSEHIGVNPFATPGAIIAVGCLNHCVTAVFKLLAAWKPNKVNWPRPALAGTRRTHL
jgi:hypothetical protein